MYPYILNSRSVISSYAISCSSRGICGGVYTSVPDVNPAALAVHVQCASPRKLQRGVPTVCDVVVDLLRAHVKYITL